MAHSILIVDDEAGIRQSLGGVLEDEGFNVTSVGSGEDCLRAFDKRLFACVLLDVWLPGMDGLETLERLKGVYPDVAVVMVTTNPVSGLQRLKRPRLMAYNDLYVRLAGDEDVSLFDGSARWASPPPPRTDLPDGLHPDPEAEAALYTPPLAALVAGIFGHTCAP